MNRREMLKVSFGTGLSLFCPSISIAEPKYDWFTHNQLMKILSFVDVKGRAAIEKMNFNNPVDCWGSQLELHAAFYLSTIRLANIMYRRTLCASANSDHCGKWMIMSPEIRDRQMWWPHQLPELKTIKEVSPGVFKTACVHANFNVYIDEQFPKDIIMMGLGYHEVIRFKKTGKMLKQQYSSGRYKNETYEYPEIVAYMGRPTGKYYSLIKHVG